MTVDLSCSDTDLAIPSCGWYEFLIQECHTAIQECTRWIQEVIFFTVATEDFISLYQRRSEDNDDDDNNNNNNNNHRLLHTYVLMDQPVSGNNKKNVRFSPAVEDAVSSKRALINVTGEDSNISFQDWLVGDSGAGCSVISNKKLLTNAVR